ncbi:hypothetical protein [Candidatus Nitrosotenuis uzonensis]|uniref:Uncharacterized protein n=1 Tax=Candidatus Nitrosotenuis uzonensis TaxID=1407055 RepID=A0A812EZC7_9ARCH|nr:hypothetical protein [Candidatus Nitrosotenuis uzonensis]CAE6486771.1 conserved hypothetical protein [Candidatus Nitrosotenuis uzonensis]
MKSSKDDNNRISKLEKRVEKLENAVFKGSSSYSVSKNTLEDTLVKEVNKIPIQHLVVISLKLNGKQTRDEIKKSLEDWGKVFGNWFRGGNFNNRLIKMNIVKRDDKNKDGDDIFVLTKKGELLANELIEKIRSKK